MAEISHFSRGTVEMISPTRRALTPKIFFHGEFLSGAVEMISPTRRALTQSLSVCISSSRYSCGND